MLEKLIRIDNVGVFKKGVPTAIVLKKATLIYAENARGKSTLSATLRSLSTGDPTPVTARETFGGGTQSVDLRLATATGTVTVNFTNGQWNTTAPNVIVFDQEFVERNVYAGSEVGSDQHQALLEFALGSAAIKKKLQVDEASAAQLAATGQRSEAEGMLKGYMGKFLLTAFLALPEQPDIDAKIVDLEAQIGNAATAAAIKSRSKLKRLETPASNLQRFKSILEKSLTGVHTRAEALVKASIAKCEHESAERWVAQGYGLLKDDRCPFCGQGTKNLEIVEAYRTYFDEAYIALQTEVASLPMIALGSIAAEVFDGFDATDGVNRERMNSWLPQVKLSVPQLDLVILRQDAGRISATLAALAVRKKQMPLDAIDAKAEMAEVERVQNSIAAEVAAYNLRIDEANAAIDAFLITLESQTDSQLKTQKELLLASKARFQPDVIELVAKREAANGARSNAETAKKLARAELDALMLNLLQTFQQNINDWLTKFGAPFSVGKLKANYQGTGTPRTEYGIVVRDTTVPAGKKGAGPSFQTTLSDGDKRALALAFFLAKLFSEPNIGDLVVVLDDIVTSLDMHRRAQTVDAISKITATCAQAIVLAHDAFFLRDLARRLRGKKGCESVVLQARRTTGAYSELEVCDLEPICSSDYYKRYKALQEFLDGAQTADLLCVAQGLRTLLEGHLHRRFPGRVKEGVTVGEILQTIEDAKTGDPLAFLQPFIADLLDLNEFSSTFHHDTDGIAPRTAVTDGELKTYGQKIMTLIHTGQF